MCIRDRKNRVELFRVTSGPRKTENALKLLHKALYNIKNKRYIKNRLSCTGGYGCKFYKTEHCPWGLNEKDKNSKRKEIALKSLEINF